MVLVDQGEAHMLPVVRMYRLKFGVDLNIEEASNIEEDSNHEVGLNNGVDSSIGERLNEASDEEGDLLEDTTPGDTVEERISNNGSSSNSSNTLISLSPPLRSCRHCHSIMNLSMGTTNHHPSLWRTIYRVLMSLINLRRFNPPLLLSNKAHRLSLFHFPSCRSLWIRHASICLGSWNII